MRGCVPVSRRQLLAEPAKLGTAVAAAAAAAVALVLRLSGLRRGMGEQPGEYAFACSMGMYRGTLVVE